MIVNYREISDFQGYRVGDSGSVQSCLNAHPGCSGRHSIFTSEWRELSPGRMQSGHLHVSLYRAGVRHIRRVHRLVLEAFVGPRPPGMVCAHNDGNPANNRLDNLRWDTQAGNVADRIIHGTSAHGSRNHMAKLNPEIAAEIVTLRKSGWTHRRIADHFHISQASVYNVLGYGLWLSPDNEHPNNLKRRLKRQKARDAV